MKPTVIITVVAATAAIAASAQQQAQSDTASVTLSSVEVTANRAGVKTPVAFSNLKASQIKEANDGRDIPYILQTTPSVVVTGDAGAGVGYSSMRVRGTDPSRINVTANGVPINDSESSRTYWVNMPDIASSLRDIQVQRGAGTSANGAGAFGASINMITAAPKSASGAEAAASWGSYNTNRQSIKVNSGTIGQHWSADARISHIGSDGYIDRASSALWGYSAQLAYNDGPTSVRLLAFGGKERTYMAWDYASKAQMEKYGRRYNPCGQYTAADGSTAFYKDQFDNYAQHHLHLIATHSFSNRTSLNVTGHYTRGDGYYEQYKTGRKLIEYGLQPYVNAQGETVKKSDLVRLKFSDNDFGGFMTTLRHETGRVNAVAGAAANWFMGHHYGQVSWVRNYIGPIDPLQNYYNNNGRKMEANAYVRADIGITDRLSGYADLQYRHIRYSIVGTNDVYDYNTSAPATLDILRRYNFFNPKGGLAWNSGPQRIYASVSVAHKEPVRSNFTDADPGRYPNPERLVDYEAGWSWQARNWSIGAGLYYMDYTDQLAVTGQLSDTGNPLSVNVPRSYRAGIELQGQWRPLAWLDWNASATLSRNRIKDFVEYLYEDEYTNPWARPLGDTPLAFSPSAIVNNALKATFGNFEATFTTRYVSKQYMDNAASPEAMLDAYTTSDLGAAYTWNRLAGAKSLRLSATVYNVFNAKYFNNGYTGAGYTVGSDGQREIYRYAGFAAQAPINFLTTVALTF